MSDFEVTDEEIKEYLESLPKEKKTNTKYKILEWLKFEDARCFLYLNKIADTMKNNL